jgi:hypothetical protein
VYNEYKKTWMNNTTFIIEQDPSDQHTYLVRHEKGTRDFYWAKHAFRVYAIKETEVYNCECMQWKHTGKTIAPIFATIPCKFLLIKH